MKRIPKGMIVPVVTPFKEDQSIDFDAFKKVIDFVLSAGLDGILIAGSTGEYRTMSHEEHREVIKKGCEFVAGRVPIMAGVGQYTSESTIELANFAAECGAEWGLVLPPYYQMTSEQGVKDFFLEIADGSKLGIVVYNNPLATSVALSPEFIYDLAQHENIVCLKDTADMEHTSKTIALTRNVEGFSVFQGFEHSILPALAIGADGGFAILMNLLPKEYTKLYDCVKAGEWKDAAKLNMEMASLYTMMEGEPYPGPVKAGMNLIGIPAGGVRKPLVQPSEGLKAEMAQEMRKLGYQIP